MSTQGLDVSEFQGEIDWERVKNAGYRFAMLRAGYGSGTIDRRFRRNASASELFATSALSMQLTGTSFDSLVISTVYPRF